MFFSFLLCFVSALLLIFSFPSFDFYFFAWFGLVPLFFALKNKNRKQAFFLSYFWGIIFWAGILYWLIKLTFLGYFFLVLYLAIYSGLFGLITNYRLRVTNYGLRTTDYGLRITNYELLFLPSIWILLEFLRSHLFTGFGWALLGYSQYKNLPFIQIADLTGAYGVSFLIVLVNLTIYLMISKEFPIIYKLKKSLFSLVLISLVLTYGYYKIHQKSKFKNQIPLKISLIQANISPYEKWSDEFKEEIIKKYISLTKKAIRESPQLIIWPETSFPGFWEEEKELREKILNLANETNTGILVGAPTLENDLSYNSAVLVSKEGKELFRYEKIHLVPFGEYVPLPKIFGFLKNRFEIGDYLPGKEYKVFIYHLPNAIYRFSVLICFEDIFPDLVRRFVKEKAEFLVNITEDGWYGKSPASFQHLQALVFRAVECRRYALRSANTGYSCVVNSKGEIISELKDEKGNRLFISGILTVEIFPNTEKTFYSQLGDWFVFISFLFSLILFKRKLCFKSNFSSVII